MPKFKDPKKLLKAITDSPIFKKNCLARELNLAVSYWDFYIYQNSFGFAFNKESGTIIILDFKVHPDYHTTINSVEKFLEVAPDDLKEFILFNLDLF